MKDVTLAKASKDWKDRAAGWHTWRGLSTCPTCGKQFKDVLSGTQQQALAWDGECPKCDAAEALA